MKQHLTPLEVCERLIGPPEVLSVICRYNSKAAYNWRHPSSSRDAGDIPSPKLMRLILAYVEPRGIPLTAEHLVRGAPASEIEALLAARTQQVAAE